MSGGGEPKDKANSRRAKENQERVLKSKTGVVKGINLGRGLQEIIPRPQHWETQRDSADKLALILRKGSPKKTRGQKPTRKTEQEAAQTKETVAGKPDLVEDAKAV